MKDSPFYKQWRFWVSVTPFILTAIGGFIKMEMDLAVLDNRVGTLEKQLTGIEQATDNIANGIKQIAAYFGGGR